MKRVSIWNKPIREWNEEDVMDLVPLGRTEGPSLEYKAQLYDEGERGNRELLLDICSMGTQAAAFYC